MAAPNTCSFGFLLPEGKPYDDSCYIELTLKQAKINFAQIREVCKIDSENQQTFCK